MHSSSVSRVVVVVVYSQRHLDNSYCFNCRNCKVSCEPLLQVAFAATGHAGALVVVDETPQSRKIVAQGQDIGVVCYGVEYKVTSTRCCARGERNQWKRKAREGYKRGRR
jgi:hypothetical protein